MLNENTIHIFPSDEDHCDMGLSCRCKPRVEAHDPKTGKPYPNNGKIVIHNSFDGREVIEEAEEIKEITEKLLES